MGNEGMRAGDADRQRIADQLRVALDEGRLDLGEFDERVQKAYAARTYGDLEGLLDDLPGTVPLEKSQVEPRHQPAAEVVPQRRSGPALPGILAVFVVCTLVWAMTSAGSGELRYFWPGWLLIPVVWASLAHFRDRGKRGD